MSRSRALAVVLAVAGLLGLWRAPADADDPPGWPLAACAIAPDGSPVHCRCLFSDPVGLPVDDPAECPPPVPTTVVDCWLPTGEPCEPSSTTSTTTYVPTPADVNDLPIEPAPVVDLEPRFTG